MKSNRIIMGVAGAALFLSIVLTFIWIFPNKNHSLKNELPLAEAVSKIKNREVSEVLIKQDELVITGKEREKFYAKIGDGDAPRESILIAVEEVNKNNPGTIKVNLEQSSSGWGWFVLLNSLPFYLMWAATLAVIVYATRSLSRNKG